MAPEDYRCAAWTAMLDPDPIGSAPRFDQLILVEMPLPWPRDVSDMPGMGAVADRDPLTRVMAVVPSSDCSPDMLVTVWRRSGVGMVGTEGVVPRHDLDVVLEALVDRWTPAYFEGSPAELLVCAHGSRDRCCGSRGTRLFTDVSARGWPLRVRRCSHLGGHRFAPTAMTLPDGRLWSRIDGDTLEGLTNRTADPLSLHRCYRGNSGIEPWAQAVERAVLEEIGWEWITTPLTSCDVTLRGERAEIDLRWEGGAAVGVVEIGLTYPVIDCGHPPEMATKFSHEYRLVDLNLRRLADPS